MREFIGVRNVYFLRNDEIPIAFVAAYPRAIVNASKRNRLKFETEKKV